MTVEFTVKIYGKTVEITPVEPIKDNSIYEITISDIRAWKKRSKHIELVEHKVYTKLSPSYCSLESVLSLVDSIDIDEDRLLFYIKEASKYAEYISGATYSDDPPFHISQFVKFRAAHDSLLRLFIERATEAGRRGQLAEIQFEVTDTDSLKDLLDYLKGESKRWEDEIADPNRTKGAAPKAVVRSSPGHYATKLSGYQRGSF